MDKKNLSQVDNVLLQLAHQCQVGTLTLTQHHLVFQPSQEGVEEHRVSFIGQSAVHSHASISLSPTALSFQIPYALLALVTRQSSLLPLNARRPASTSSNDAPTPRPSKIYPLGIRLRTFQALALGFESEAKATDVFQRLKTVAILRECSGIR